MRFMLNADSEIYWRQVGNAGTWSVQRPAWRTSDAEEDLWPEEKSVWTDWHPIQAGTLHGNSRHDFILSP